ncbi:hypothetical protein BHM03_00016015 [Ensete ventricosum]|nr:hypothetical protein BHM03_00016015 [Ensete ventricosum]
MVATTEEATTVAHPDWREEILHYKRDATLPTDKESARYVKRTEACLAFGNEVVLLPEVVFPTLEIENFTPEASEAGLRENLDLLEERRTETHLKTLHYQRAVARLYNCRIQLRPIGMGDLVLRKAEVRLVEIHPHVGVLRTFSERVLLDLYLRMVPPQLYSPANGPSVHTWNDPEMADHLGTRGSSLSTDFSCVIMEIKYLSTPTRSSTSHRSQMVYPRSGASSISTNPLPFFSRGPHGAPQDISRLLGGRLPDMLP